MEESPNLLESLLEKVENYSVTTYELSKLKILEITTSVVTTLISRLIVLFMFFIFVVVLNIGIALLLSDWLGKIYYGFFIIAAFYLVAVIVLHRYLNSWIKKYLSDLIIAQSLR
jgi:hypothetical protein